jgi:hypothetical protein
MRDGRNTRCEKRIHAGRGAPEVVARLQRDDGRATLRPVTRATQCHHFGVRSTGRLRGTDAGNLAVAVQDHRSDGRIRVGAALHLLGQVDRQPHGRFDVHHVGRLAAAAACLRNASTAAAGSAAL